MAGFVPAEQLKDENYGRNKMQGIKVKGILAIAVVTAAVAIAGCAKSEESVSADKKQPGAFTKYGVFIGAGAEEIINGLEGEYDVLVVDAAGCTDDQIAEIKEKKVSDGGRLYTYLNVGSLETFRDYYDEFKDITLGEYENWDGEYWIDITNESWQQFITETLAKQYADMGVDGFFVDNFDVCHEFGSDEMYAAAESILDALGDYDVDVIINGADPLVKKLMEEKKTSLFDGVNQECVFSKIVDYENEEFAAQDEEEKAYYTDYLKEVKDRDLLVYIIEYTGDDEVRREIAEFCMEENCVFYACGTLELGIEDGDTHENRDKTGDGNVEALEDKDE